MISKDVFTVQCAQSNVNKCCTCDSLIEVNTLCLLKKNESSDMWYHISCFNEIKDDFEFDKTAELLVGLCLSSFDS